MKKRPSIAYARAELAALLDRLAEPETEYSRGDPITTPALLERYVRPYLASARMERFVVVFLDTKFRVIGAEPMVFEGLPDQVVICPRRIFAEGFRRGAVGFTVAHNHPSGDPTPSRSDHHLTKRLAECGVILAMPLFDSLVVAEGGIRSILAEANP